jgi:hypothetical protein
MAPVAADTYAERGLRSIGQSYWRSKPSSNSDVFERLVVLRPTQLGTLA